MELIHTIPKIWEKWIPTVRKNMGKHKHFKVKGFWNVLLEAEIHAVPNTWEKWISTVRGSMGKHKHFKFMSFLNISDEAEIHTISKTWKKWIPMIREKYGKKQTFQSNGFLKYFGWSRNPYNSQNMGKVNLHSTGKVRENTEISHSLRYLADLEFMRTHGIPNVCECTNSHKMEIFCGKPYHSQAVGFWGN